MSGNERFTNITFSAVQIETNQKAEGLKVYLCLEHHISGKEAVHNNAEMMKVLRQDGQRAFEKTHTREEFMKLFGKNYLEETGG